MAFCFRSGPPTRSPPSIFPSRSRWTLASTSTGAFCSTLRPQPGCGCRLRIHSRLDRLAPADAERAQRRRGACPAWPPLEPAQRSRRRADHALADPAVCLGTLPSQPALRGTIDVGFRSRGIVMMAIDPQLHQYTPERSVVMLRSIRERMAALPRRACPRYGDGWSTAVNGPSQRRLRRPRPGPSLRARTSLSSTWSLPNTSRRSAFRCSPDRGIGDENPDAPTRRRRQRRVRAPVLPGRKPDRSHGE